MSDPAREYRELRDEIDEAVAAVLASGRYVLGEAVESFEAAFADAVGARHAVGVASGTDAIELALEALGVGPGDEVVTTPFTFPATATAIVAAGATPVFADILPDTFALDPGAAAAAITDRTAAIVPVHLFGQMADMPALSALAERHGVPLVEDAAQAFGATGPGSDGTESLAGSVGAAGCFSFYPTKSLGAAGDGGMVVTDDSALADRLRRLRNHGRGPDGGAAGAGHNSRLDALQAAVLSAKLPHASRWTGRRREHAAAYDDALSEAPAIRPPSVAPGNRHIFHQYTVLCHGRDRVAAALDDAGIASAAFYDPPVHRLEAVASRAAGTLDLPVAEELSRRVLSIPVFTHLGEDERARVTDVLAEVGSLVPG